MVVADGNNFEPWQKDFEVGEIGLGVNSLSGAGDHYFVSLQPLDPTQKVEVTDIYPEQHTFGTLSVGAKIYWNSSDSIEKMPESLQGQVLLRGDSTRRRAAQITNIFMMTQYPSTKRPTDIVLTWSGDPHTTQSIQWRTNTDVAGGSVRFQEQDGTLEEDGWKLVTAETAPLKNATLVNDPICHHHTAVIEGLNAATTYVYQVADGTAWTEQAEFTTAPDTAVPFKFIYMGDVQAGFDTWGELVQGAFTSVPDAAFYVLAGDLVNRGNQREEWDSLFHNAEGIFDRRQLAPVIGNHECQGELGPWMYLDIFDLPENGPSTIPAERAYSFHYSNALFVMLDSNLPPEQQTEWLEAQLADTGATWKIVVYHHPLYSSDADRDNGELRQLWGSLFDKYHVDLALQGHDHAYLRTYPMNAGKRVESPADGTVYIVSNSGSKFYEQGDHDYTEVGMTNVSLYQVLDLTIEDDTLIYKSFDKTGTVKDEFVIKK